MHSAVADSLKDRAGLGIATTKRVPRSAEDRLGCAHEWARITTQAVADTGADAVVVPKSCRGRYGVVAQVDAVVRHAVGHELDAPEIAHITDAHAALAGCGGWARRARNRRRGQGRRRWRR